MSDTPTSTAQDQSNDLAAARSQGAEGTELRNLYRTFKIAQKAAKLRADLCDEGDVKRHHETTIENMAFAATQVVKAALRLGVPVPPDEGR